MKRRAFITLLGGAAAWPLAARAQQGERMRRIGVLITLAADDPLGQAQVAAFQQALQQLGWSDGRNVRIDIRRNESDADRARRYAQELVALAPDIFLASGTLCVTALQHVTRTLPIVFATVADPVGAGFVDSLSRPGGNITGFMAWEYSFSGKWLELLKQIAPQVTRAAIIRDPAISVGTAVFGAIQAAALSLGVLKRRAFITLLGGGAAAWPFPVTGPITLPTNRACHRILSVHCPKDFASIRQRRCR
jgi:putative ABC transport system substrate-binding protein